MIVGSIHTVKPKEVLVALITVYQLAVIPARMVGLIEWNWFLVLLPFEVALGCRIFWEAIKLIIRAEERKF